MDTYGGLLIIPTQLSSIIPYIYLKQPRFFHFSHDFCEICETSGEKKHRTLFLLSSSPNIVGLFRLENVGIFGRVFEWYIPPCTLKVQDRTKNGHVKDSRSHQGKVEATHICALDLPVSPRIPVASGGFGRDPRLSKKRHVTTSGDEPASLNYELVAETPIEKNYEPKWVHLLQIVVKMKKMKPPL